jgi:type IV secretory pathway protease TraF
LGEEAFCYSKRPYVGSVPVGPQTGCKDHPIHLEAGEYFILGDNSRISYDGRYWAQAAPGHQLGAVPRDWIFGRATAIYWPLNRIRQFR